MEEKYYKWVKASEEKPKLGEVTFRFEGDEREINGYYDYYGKWNEPNFSRGIFGQHYSPGYSTIEWKKELSPASISKADVLRQYWVYAKNEAEKHNPFDIASRGQYQEGIFKGIHHILSTHPASPASINVESAEEILKRYLPDYKHSHFWNDVIEAMEEYKNPRPQPSINVEQEKLLQKKPDYNSGWYEKNQVGKQQYQSDLKRWQSQQPSINVDEAAEKVSTFLEWAFKNYQWTGDTWDENTGHDDFESYTHKELFIEWQSKQQIMPE